MKLRELIASLELQDPELEVLINNEETGEQPLHGTTIEGQTIVFY